MNRDDVRFITLAHYNHFADTNYKSVTELIFSPPPFSKEIEIRAQLGITPYDLSIILVVEDIPDKKIEILCQSKTYDDVKEVLLPL